MQRKVIIRQNSSKPVTPLMMKKILSRLDVGNIDDINVEIVNYDKEHPRASFEKGIISITSAFIYLCDALAHKKALSDLNKIKLFAKSLENKHLDFLQTRTSFNDYQQVMQDHLKDIYYLVFKKLSFPSEKALSILNMADEYIVLSQMRPVLITVSPLSCTSAIPIFAVQIEIPQSGLSKEIRQEFVSAKQNNSQAPEWYRLMGENEKIIFDYFMSDIKTSDDVDAKIHTIPSRLRSIPGVANFSKHKLMVLDTDGKVECEPLHRYRSSMISSRNLLKVKAGGSVRLDFAFHNLSMIVKTGIENYLDRFKSVFVLIDGAIDKAALANFLENTPIPILLQTLITPTTLASRFVPDRKLYKDKIKAIEKLLIVGVPIEIGHGKNKFQFQYTPAKDAVIETNHPLNIARGFSPTGGILDSTTQPQLKTLILVAEAYQHYNPDASDEIKAVVQNISSLLQNAPTPGVAILSEKNGRELHLASLQELLITRMQGIAYGSCVSGKDRKGLQTMYVDAMEIYHHLYGRFPECYDEGVNRENFVAVYADLFLTRHQQMNAGQNASRADGIKTPAGYLPEDIQKAIIKASYKDILVETSRLASNNDIDKIDKKLSLTTNEISYLNEAFNAFDELNNQDTQNKLSQSLIKIIDIVMHDQWKLKSTGHSNVPEGIEQLGKILSDPLTLHLCPEDIIFELAKVCNLRISIQHKTDMNYRLSETKDIYQAIITVAHNCGNLKSSHTKDIDRMYEEILSAKDATKIPSDDADPVVVLKKMIESKDVRMSKKVDVDKAKFDVRRDIAMIINAPFWNDKGVEFESTLLFFGRGVKTPSGVVKMRKLIPELQNKLIFDDSVWIKQLASLLREKTKYRAFCTEKLYELIFNLNAAYKDNKNPLEDQAILRMFQVLYTVCEDRPTPTKYNSKVRLP